MRVVFILSISLIVTIGLLFICLVPFNNKSKRINSNPFYPYAEINVQELLKDERVERIPEDIPLYTYNTQNDDTIIYFSLTLDKKNIHRISHEYDIGFDIDSFSLSNYFRLNESFIITNIDYENPYNQVFVVRNYRNNCLFICSLRKERKLLVNFDFPHH